jgi:hypothetical protein
MRQLSAILGALALVAGCTTVGTSPGASPAASPVVSMNPTVPPTQAPSPSPAAVSARMAFDGTTCEYDGPTVIPSPALLTVEYRPTADQEESAVVLFAIRSDTTTEEIARTEQDPNQAAIAEGSAPAWVDGATFHAMFGSGTGTFPDALHVWRLDDGTVYDRYFIDCATAEPFVPVPGQYTILRLVDTVGPSVVPSATP